MKSNFDFLNNKFPILSTFGKQAESYCYSDSNSCLMKLGIIGETIVNTMLKLDDVYVPQESNAASKINLLYREGLIDRALSDDLHSLRKMRNKAVHENYESTQDSKSFLEMVFGICVWFFQTYGDWDFQSHTFIMPSEQSISPSVAVSDKKAEEQADAKASEKAVSETKVDTSISREKRKAQSAKMANQRKITEAETRIRIDQQLQEAGWEADTANLRYSKGTRPIKGRNLAIAEWPTDSTVGNQGFADYALFIGTKMVGIVEAKAEHKDIPSVIDYQCKDYARNIRLIDDDLVIDYWGKYKVPFVFAANGRPYLQQYRTKSGIWFQDLRDTTHSPKALQGWYSPAGLKELLDLDVNKGNQKLKDLSYDFLTDKSGLNLRKYQISAIEAVESAVVDGKQTALLAMATGTGKTRTVLGLLYRLLKTDRFRRILFLVDRKALGDQALDTFKDIKIEDLKTLDQIYSIKELGDKEIEGDTKVHIATVQGMVRRILYNEGDVKPSVSDYDLVIVDEAHRGYISDKEMHDFEAIYRDQRDFQSKYRSVIEYFDAVKVALTATPTINTTEIFGAPVFNYTYRQAVIDGYLVDHDAPHHFETKLSQNGIHYKKGDMIAIHDPVTNEITNSELLDDELDFEVDQFNRKVINENFNRAVLTELAKDYDPEDPDEGKMLIYAVDDKHADMIVTILKEIYGEYGVDTDSIMKITGSVGGGNPKKVEEAIRRFKNERFPSIAVTVDLLTTGIDVPEITKLVFLRQVKSRVLFEQMLGRATRLCPAINKTKFDIYDAVNVYEVIENVSSMKPVEVNPKTTFKELVSILEQQEEPAQISFQIDQITAKLQRKKRILDEDELEKFKYLSDGKTPDEYISEIESLPAEEAKRKIVSNSELFKFLDQVRVKGTGRVVISDESDELVEHSRGYGKSDKPEDYLEEFADYLQERKKTDKVVQIICTNPELLTMDELNQYRTQLDLEGFTEKMLNTAIEETTSEYPNADIISFTRKYILDSELKGHEERIHEAMTRLRKNHKFTKMEDSWNKRIEKFMMNHSILNVQIFDEVESFKDNGGFKRINKAYGGNLENIVHEINSYLYDDGPRRFYA